MSAGNHSIVFREFSPEELLGPLNEVERKNAPPRLFAAGHPEFLDNGARVSLVGSRKASQQSLDLAWALSKHLAKEGVVIVSGLAEGIDTTAHRAAMEACGRTVAVIGTPLNENYPYSNQDLQALIMREHLCLSQFPVGSPTRKGNFPLRNRTMALISDATVIVEAGETSGTLHQGWEALRLGRPLFLFQSIVENTSLAWTKDMLRCGAQVIEPSAVDLLFEFLPERTGEKPAAMPF